MNFSESGLPNTLGSVYEQSYTQQEINFVLYNRFKELISKLEIDPKFFILTEQRNFAFDKVSNSISSYGEIINMISENVDVLNNNVIETLKTFFNNKIFEHSRGENVRILILANYHYGIGIELLPIYPIWNEDFTITTNTLQLKITYAIV